MKDILIIKLGAAGDVLRTLPIIALIKRSNPSSAITLFTKPGDLIELLQTQKYLDHIISSPSLLKKEYALLYNFDTDREAMAVAQKVKAQKKYGFYSEEGYPSPYNSGSEYYLNTMFDDSLKKSNRRTYQEMMSEVAELIPQKTERYTLEIPKKFKEYADTFFKEKSLKSAKTIGLHIGSSPRWPSKSWNQKQIIELARLLAKEKLSLLLFGGPDELKTFPQIIEKLKSEGITVHTNNPDNSKMEFAALLSHCKAFISGDTFGLHVAVGLSIPTIALFFCTSPYEIEEYGLITKIISPKLSEFFPERSDEYSEELTNSISAQQVYKVLKEII